MDIIASSINPRTSMGPQISHFWSASKADMAFSFIFFPFQYQRALDKAGSEIFNSRQ